MPVDYAQVAPVYDRFRSSPQDIREYWLPTLVRLMGVKPGSRVLDVGCGTGRLAVPLAERHRITGADTSPEMLAVARSKGSEAEFVRAEVRRLPFRHGSFAVAIAVEVLHLVPDLGEAVWEIGRVAHRVVVGTIDMERRTPHALDEAFPSFARIDAARFPPIAAIEDACRKAGWRRIETQEARRQIESSTEEFLERVRGKYVSTLALLPPGEFERGLAWLERTLPKRGRRYTYDHAVTFVTASR